MMRRKLTRATPVGPDRKISLAGCFSSSSHLKSQPCIPGEYVGLVFLSTEDVGFFGVALVCEEGKTKV